MSQPTNVSEFLSSSSDNHCAQFPENYVTLLSELRTRLTNLATELGRIVPYEITLASAAGEWTIRPGYDLNGIMQYADFINVMTYDYYGAWGSQWGAYTGELLTESVYISSVLAESKVSFL